MESESSDESEEDEDEDDEEEEAKDEPLLIDIDGSTPDQPVRAAP